MNIKITENTNYNCLKCKYVYIADDWFEPSAYCGKFNIKENPNIIGIRNRIPSSWINNGLNCSGFEKKYEANV